MTKEAAVAMPRVVQSLKQARALLEAYDTISPSATTDEQVKLTEILVDLLHYADVFGLRSELAVRTARLTVHHEQALSHRAFKVEG